MDDPLKKLGEQSINGKPGVPRFEPGQLKFVEINDRYVTFYLRTHALAVMIEDLTAEEASLARLYYRDPASPRGNKHETGDDNGLKTADVDQKDSPETVNGADLDSSTYDPLDDDLDNGPTDVIVDSPPRFAANYRFIFTLMCICLVIGFVGVVLLGANINNAQFDKDKNEATAIAMQEPSLQSFIAGKDVSVDSSAEYANPQSASKRQSMSVDIWVFVKANGDDASTDRLSIMPSMVRRFIIYVDLENKKITSTHVIHVFP